jgi:GNAT superfamily N-acetyltransferase
MPQQLHEILPALDNPIWHALDGKHGALAARAGRMAWYPSTIAPFIAVPSSGIVPELHAALAGGFHPPAYFVGTIPETLPAGWLFSSRSSILQMMPTGAAVPDIETEDIRELQIGDRPRMLELARAAFPDYFRERTAELGLYLGIFSGARLVAMAGERLAVDGWQEISGVCTHPEFGGRGYARRLTLALMIRHRQRGVASFLHVSEGNAVARRLYESMGFEARVSLPLAKLECTEKTPS